MRRRRSVQRTVSPGRNRKQKRRNFLLLGEVAFAMCAVLVAIVCTVPATFRFALSASQTAAIVLSVLSGLANGDRAQNDLAPLRVSPVLVAVAQAKADDMAAKGYFAHTSPEGLDPWHWFSVIGYPFSYAGENLAVNFTDSTEVNTAWMQSPLHRANILNPHYTEMGIAVSQGLYQGRQATFVVQEFGAPVRGTQASSSTASVQKQPSAPTTISTVKRQ